MSGSATQHGAPKPRLTPRAKFSQNSPELQSGLPRSPSHRQSQWYHIYYCKSERASWSAAASDARASLARSSLLSFAASLPGAPLANATAAVPGPSAAAAPRRTFSSCAANPW